MSGRNRVFLFACGGTGGHIFPALSVGEELGRRGDARIVYICGKKDIESAIFNAVKPPEVVSIETLPYRGLRSVLGISFWWRLAKGFLQSLALIRRERPALAVGFGGYISFPVIAAAKVLNVPTMIHEQNVVPGKANRLLARHVDAVAASFPETSGHWRGLKNSRVTGNPVRSAIERQCRDEALRYFDFDAGKKTLMVLGGSQGAESINTFFLEALKELPEGARRKLQVLHLCGRMKPEESERACRQAGVAARAFSFFNRMDLAYAAADFCVGRAGATFLAEVRTKHIPVLLVPYPFGDGHQRANAEAYRGLIGARVCEQGQLDGKKLAGILQEMMQETAPEKTDAPQNARVLLAEYIEECATRN